ncbi:MAG: DNA polymerase III subunit alpha, partial [Deltaproteobacteria bacterium]|nr:DNA polymerase III subunit alpha [Deltaproteobacteria bacterium]
GFPGYFLIVSDFIQWARDHKIMVGPGRGSGAGSLAAWCLGIINVDPIRYGLLFERFLNPERKSMPDFDVDFCAEGRGEVIRYVTEKYGGSEYVAQILAVGQMKAKAVIRDVGRALGLDLQFVDPLAKLIPDNNTIGQALEAEPQLQELAKSNPQVQTLLEYGRLLENLPRHSSVHASGIVISDRPLMEYLPLMCDTKQPEQNGLRLQAVTQYEKKEIEANGLVKFDLLGLKNMTLIKHCLALLAKRGVNINLDDLDFKDEKTFDLLCSGKVNGVFQLDGPGIRRILVRLAPRSLEDISVLLALYRPGPIKGGKVDEYVEIHHGRQKAHIPLPQMVPILEETHGVIVYQEQAMMICRVLAGYSMGDADLIRRAMGEKKPEQMGEMKASFLEGCQKNRIPAEQAAQAFDAIANFAEYGFNKSHSLAYAVVTYQTAWLKTHYLPEFMAAFFTSEMDKPERIGRFLDDGRRSGLTIRPPSVNWSEYTFTVSEGDIIYGLGAVKGVGQGAAEAIAAERKEGGPYEDLFDLCRRVNSKKINSRTLEALIYAGAFDGLGDQPREVMAAALPEAMSQSRKGRNKKPEAGLFDFLAAPELPASGKWPKAELLTEMEILNLEKDCLGFFLSGHPLDRYEGAFRALSSTPLGRLRLKPDKTPVSLAGRISRVVHKIDRKDRAFVFATLADRTSSAELAVWSRMLKKCKEFLQEDRLVYLEGILQESRSERFGPNVEVTAMLSLEDSLTKVRSLFIRTLKADLPLLADFLLPHLKTKSGGDPVVWIGIQDSRGESFYRLDQSLKLSADLLDEARRSLGSLMEIRCLMTDGPAAVRS